MRRASGTPRVTVLMAVHDGEPHLGETIDSVLAQTYGDFEFLIVDDGSTDGSREIVRAFADPRIRLLENPGNLGLARSLNRGLAAARGEFVARQDADDLSEPRRLAHQVAYLDAHPEVALLGTWHTEIDAEGRPLRGHTLPCDYRSLRWALLFHCPFVHSAVMLRRASVLEAVGGYDESLSYAMDYELWARIARKFPVANLGEPLLRLRTHARSMTATFGERAREGERLRQANLARLLRWPEPGAEVDDREARFRALAALYRGTADGVGVHPLLGALDDMLRLQRAFSAEAGLSRDESHEHRVWLLRHVARRLVTLREQRRATIGRTDSLRLLFAAFRLRARANGLAAARRVRGRGQRPTGMPRSAPTTPTAAAGFAAENP